MKVYELIRILSELSQTGDQEVGVVQMDGHDNPRVTTNFSIEMVMINKDGQIVYDDEQEGENVVVVGI